MDGAAYDEASRNAAKAKANYDKEPTPENKDTLDAFVGEMYRKSGHDADKITSLGYDLTTTNMDAAAPPWPGATRGISSLDGKEYWTSPDGRKQRVEEADAEILAVEPGESSAR